MRLGGRRVVTPWCGSPDLARGPHEDRGKRRVPDQEQGVDEPAVRYRRRERAGRLPIIPQPEPTQGERVRAAVRRPRIRSQTARQLARVKADAMGRGVRVLVGLVVGERPRARSRLCVKARVAVQIVEPFCWERGADEGPHLGLCSRWGSLKVPSVSTFGRIIVRDPQKMWVSWGRLDAWGVKRMDFWCPDTIVRVLEGSRRDILIHSPCRWCRRVRAGR